MHSSDDKLIEPYRIFFSVSIFGAIFGVILWVLAWISQKKWLGSSYSPYPIIHHINIMSAVFLLPVVKGFVYTAIPRFTATNALSQIEIIVFFILQFLVLTFVFFYEDSFLFYSFQTLDFGILFLFLVHRFKISKVNLSGYLYFLLGGVFLGVIGSLLQLTSLFAERNFLFSYGKDFIFYGMIPCIIFGTGTRMIPMIINTENPAKKMEWMQKAESQKAGKSILIIFILSFLLEFSLGKFVDSRILILLKGIRFVICTIWIVKYFHILEISNFKGKLSKTILVACYLFIIGLAGYSFGFQYSAHLAHIYLIGGLSLLVVSIMTRVVLSHGGGDMVIEKNSNIFYWITGLIFLAAITRGSVFLFPELTTSHLAYSAILYILALILWITKVGRVIFK